MIPKVEPVQRIIDRKPKPRELRQIEFKRSLANELESSQSLRTKHNRLF
jgi:hypothetical protein